MAKWIFDKLIFGVQVAIRTSNFWRIPFFFLNPDKKQMIKFHGTIPTLMNFRQFISLGGLMVRGYFFTKNIDNTKTEFWTVYLKNNHRLVGDDRMINFIGGSIEYWLKDFDFQKKRVLDIGGFLGDTAVLFSSEGASHITIYEPVLEYVAWIQRNVETNNIDAEIHAKGIGDKDKSMEINYNSLDDSIGLFPDRGLNKMIIGLENISDVVKNSHADIAKLNCEGGEKYLISVPENILRLIPEWIIQTHSPQIRQSILEKFTNAGFKIKNDYVLSYETSIIAFYL